MHRDDMVPIPENGPRLLPQEEALLTDTARRAVLQGVLDGHVRSELGWAGLAAQFGYNGPPDNATQWLEALASSGLPSSEMQN